MIQLSTHAIFGGTNPFILRVNTTLTNIFNSASNTFVLPLAGTSVNMKVNWGDGSSDTYITQGSKTHVYSTPGTYDIKITGTFDGLKFANAGDSIKVTKVMKFGSPVWKSFFQAFMGCDSMDFDTDIDTPTISLTNTSFKSAFYNCALFNSSVSWIPSTVTSFESTFQGCSIFNQPVNGINVSSATTLQGMFRSCTAFNQSLNSWNPLLNQTLADTFNGCTNFNQPLVGFVKSTCIGLTRTFVNCVNFNQNLGSWNVSSVTTFEAIFSGCTLFNNGGSSDIGNWVFKNTGTVSFQSMFQNAIAFNQPLNAWNVDRVTNMNFMFYNCDAFNQSLNSWNVSNVTIMTSMFSNTLLFNGNITSWIPTSLTNMGAMFANALAFNQDISGWNTSSVTFMSNVFQAGIFNQAIGIWNTSNVTNMAGMFAGSVFNQNIGAWDVSKVTTFDAMFQGAALFNNGASSSISGWVLKTTGSVNCQAMFQNATAFNQDISGWSYNVVTTMNNMLTTTTAFTTANYDLLLNALSAGVTLSSVLLGAGTKKYTIATAGAAHTNLTAVKLWTITDAGGI